jgi:hypothetical protein
MTRDGSHLAALELGLSHERERLAKAKTEGERALRRVWIAQMEKEIAGELAFLAKQNSDLPDMTDDELLAALASE